jgi:murein DD-endopeptidase MepM/ murein hydrolase activator NlpD
MQRPSGEPRFQRSQTSTRSTLSRASLTGLLLAAALLAVAVALAAVEPFGGSRPVELALEAEPVEAALPAVGLAPPPVEFPEPEPLPHIITEGELEQGTTLSRSLTRLGVAPAIVQLIASELSPYFDFRQARPGHRYRLDQNEQGELIEFVYRVSGTSGFRIVREADGLRALREEAELIPRPARLAGVVENTLYEAVVDQGENGQLARDFADVFAWDIDFQRSVRLGDEFQVLYERLYREGSDGAEEYIRPGRILAAHYEGTAGSYTAVYFETREGRGSYYRPDGTSVERQFLMAPLRHARISSSYSSARLHPILKVTRPHHGIDYAAPSGTPVWAVADGEVTYRARAGGFGNLLKIRHASGYVSYYAHLSRFAKGLKLGQKVAQKQLIGYVGQTGLATGPHLCFRIAKNGQYVNPARLRTPSGEPVPHELFSTFRTASAILLAELDAGTLFAAEGPF